MWRCTLNEHVKLTVFIRDLVTAMGLPQSVFAPSRGGVYLKIIEPEKVGDIAEVTLWRGQGNEQTPLLSISWRHWDETIDEHGEYLVAMSMAKPIRPMSALLGALFPDGKKSAYVTREQALVVLGTMVRYLETSWVDLSHQRTVKAADVTAVSFAASTTT